MPVNWRMSGQTEIWPDTPLPGARAFFSVAGTTTPLNVYNDYALTSVAAQPVTTDSNGRWPEIYIDAETYSYRITDPAGSIIVTSGTVAGDTTGGGGGGGTVITSGYETGELVWALDDAQRDYLVRCNGRTIGPAGSGASERANADCQALFEFLWGKTNYTPATLAVSGGRGASAAADWAAGKTIGLPNIGGAGLVGSSNMGGSPIANIPLTDFALGSPSQLAGTGSNTTTTLLQANLPSVTLFGTTAVISDQSYLYSYGGFSAAAGGQPVLATFGQSTQTISAQQYSVSTPLGGSNTPFSRYAPFLVGGLYIAL